MFFSSNKIIIFISKTTIQVVTVVVGNNPKKHIVFESSWTAETLPAILQKIKKDIGPRVRVLLHDDVTYIATLIVNSDFILNRSTIASKAQELIPDDITQTSWDFKVVNTTAITKTKGKSIVVAAIVQSFFKIFSNAVKKAGLHVEAIEPIAYALARFTQNYPEPIIIVHAATNSLFLFSYKGELLQTDFFTTGTLDGQIKEFLSVCTKKFSLIPHKIIVSGTNTTKLSEINGIKIETEHLDPLISLAFKKNLQSKNNDTLNLQLSLQPLQNKSEATPQKNHTKIHFLLWLLLFICVIGASSGLLAYYFQYPPFSQKSVTRENISSQTLKETPSPTKETENSATTTTSVDLSAYTIEILNGTQIPGLAKQLSDDLTAKGVTITSSGNADVDTYTQTEIRYKPSVSEEYRMALDKLIKSIYDNSIEKNAEDNQTTDVLIIIGTK